jgi:hypothetical protein
MRLAIEETRLCGENKINRFDFERRIVFMNDEKKEQEQKPPIVFSHIGGKKIGQRASVTQGKEIDFSSIQGVRCIMPPPSRAEAEPKPAESVAKEDDARE